MCSVRQHDRVHWRAVSSVDGDGGNCRQRPGSNSGACCGGEFSHDHEIGCRIGGIESGVPFRDAWGDGFHVLWVRGGSEFATNHWPVHAVHSGCPWSKPSLPLWFLQSDSLWSDLLSFASAPESTHYLCGYR